MTIKQKKYPLEFKAEVCEYVKKESIVNASTLYNLHRNTIANWVKKYKNSGINGFTVVRDDTQKTKLDKKILDKIVKYKKKHPQATLKIIRDRFSLDCHLTLISRKLRKVYRPEKINKQKETLYLQTKIIRDAEYKNSRHPVFRLSLNLCSGKPLSVGFSSWYSSEKICLFIRYSLEKLKDLKKKRIFKKIITSTKFIKKDDFATLVSNYHDIELKIVKAGEYKVCPDDDISYSEKGLKQSLIESYDKILENYNASELSNVLLTSLVNINELSKKDVTGDCWDSLFMPSETKKSFYKALEKIKEKGNKAVLEFDYDTAKNEYNKAYSGMTALKIDDKAMYLSILSEKAKLYYNIEQYQTALMLYRDISRVSRSIQNEFYLGDAYYQIAMIYKIYQNINGAVKYFKMSAKSFENRTDVMSRALYYRAKYRIYLAQGYYKDAEKYSDLYYIHTMKTGDKELIGNCLGTRGLFLYEIGKYKLFEEMLIVAKEFNVKNENYYFASVNLTNLFSLYSYAILKAENEITILLNELKKITDRIKMPHLCFESMLRIGIFYYNKEKYLESQKILSQALPGVKKHLDAESYLSNLCYIGRSYYNTEDYSKAVKFLQMTKKESNKRTNYNYLLHASHYLAEIYLIKNDSRRASNVARNSILLSERIKNIFYCGDFHLFYAKICESKSMKNNAIYHYKEALKNFRIISNSNYDLTKEIDKINLKINSIN